MHRDIRGLPAKTSSPQWLAKQLASSLPHRIFVNVVEYIRYLVVVVDYCEYLKFRSTRCVSMDLWTANSKWNDAVDASWLARGSPGRHIVIVLNGAVMELNGDVEQRGSLGLAHVGAGSSTVRRNLKWSSVWNEGNGAYSPKRPNWQASACPRASIDGLMFVYY